MSFTIIIRNKDGRTYGKNGKNSGGRRSGV